MPVPGSSRTGVRQICDPENPVIFSHHARIKIAAVGATIEDLGSKNGTFVGSQRVDGIRSIGDGDVITIASVKLTVRALQAPTSTETETDRRRFTD
jgi:pSer/pThr/pTyr-binding forkhead associated (FHA) protein